MTEFLRTDKIAEVMERGKTSYYGTLSLDLSTARTNELFEVVGDRISVEFLAGSATLKLGHKNNDAITLRQGSVIKSPYNRVFITNAAQSGRTLKLIFGRDFGIRSLPSSPTDVYSEGNPYVEEKTITTAGTPETVDINAALNGVNAHYGSVKALSTNTGAAKIKYSNNGTDYTANWHTDIQPGEGFDIDGMDIDTLKLDVTTDGDGFIIVVW